MGKWTKINALVDMLPHYNYFHHNISCDSNKTKVKELSDTSRVKIGPVVRKLGGYKDGHCHKSQILSNDVTTPPDTKYGSFTHYITQTNPCNHN